MNPPLMQLKRRLRDLPPVRHTLDRADQAAARRQVRAQYHAFRELATAGGTLDRFAMDWDPQWVYTDDATPRTGYDRHYLYHLAWASRVIQQTRPAEHYDFSSLLYFAALVSAFVPVRQHEFRPAEVQLDGLTCQQADLTDLPYPDRSVASLSCMHVVEHLGLGRYGDPLDPSADLRAFAQLQRITAVGGNLLLVVPVGRPVIRFNGCRIYAYQQVLDAVPELTLKQFALIPDDPASGNLVLDADPATVADQTYACGCFWLTRIDDGAAA